MRIIQIVGRDGTDATAFAAALIDALKEKGSVAAIKSGPDTDAAHRAEKTVTVGSASELNDALTALCDGGIEYCIIEGFESAPFPRIVFGDGETGEIVARNPASAADVLERLDRFEEFQTMQGVVKELRRSCPTERAGCILSFNGLVREITGAERTDHMDFSPAIEPLIKDLEAGARQTPGVIGARFYHRKGRLYAGEDITYFAILAEHRQEAFAAMSRAIDRLKSEVHNKH